MTDTSKEAVEAVAEALNGHTIHHKGGSVDLSVLLRALLDDHDVIDREARHAIAMRDRTRTIYRATEDILTEEVRRMSKREAHLCRIIEAGLAVVSIEHGWGDPRRMDSSGLYEQADYFRAMGVHALSTLSVHPSDDANVA